MSKCRYHTCSLSMLVEAFFCLVYCNLRRLAASRLRDRLRVKASDVSRLRERRMRSEGKRATRSGPTSKLTGSKTWEGLAPAKQHRYTCSGPQQTHKLWEVRFEFLATCMENQTWLFEQANHGAYTQILVHRWGPRLRISALFRRLCT